MVNIFFQNEEIHYFSTGTKILDCILGGGWAESKIINVVGDTKAGKSLLALEACGGYLQQYPNNKVYYADIERAYNKKYVQSLLGELAEKVTFTSLQTIEDLHNFVKNIAEPSNGHAIPSLMIVDSFDVLSSEAELDRMIDDKSFGADRAKKFHEFFRRLNSLMADKHITLFIVSQVRDVLTASFPMKTRVGGHALDHMPSQIVWLAEREKIDKTIQGVKRIIGVKVRAKCTKSRTGSPLQECEFNILFKYGVDDVSSNINWLADHNGLTNLKPIDGADPRFNVNAYIKKITSLPRDEYLKVRNHIADITLQRWQELEDIFTPSIPKKY